MKTRQRRTNKRAQNRRNNEMKKNTSGNKTDMNGLIHRMTGVNGGKFGIHAYYPKKTKVKGHQRNHKGEVIKMI